MKWSLLLFSLWGLAWTWLRRINCVKFNLIKWLNGSPTNSLPRNGSRNIRNSKRCWKLAMMRCEQMELRTAPTRFAESNNLHFTQTEFWMLLLPRRLMEQSTGVFFRVFKINILSFFHCVKIFFWSKVVLKAIFWWGNSPTMHSLITSWCNFQASEIVNREVFMRIFPQRPRRHKHHMMWCNM